MLYEEWEIEPDYHEESRILMLRHTEFLSWCGYVGVPEGHLLYRVDYCRIHPTVHGGLTFSGFWPNKRSRNPYSRLWWFGFDCGHWNDLMPGMFLMEAAMQQAYKGFNGVYRNYAYTLDWCRRLLVQLDNMTEADIAPEEDDGPI